MTTNVGQMYRIRGVPQKLREQFDALQVRLHTRTKAETFLAVCKIAQLKVDGKLEAARPRGSTSSDK
jgi:hypothetical protein